MLLAVEVAFVITVRRKHSVTFSQMLSCCSYTTNTACGGATE